MVKKIVIVGVLAAVTVVVVQSLPDIRRYLEIRQM